MTPRPAIGVLAYGSLIDDPGHEIGPATVETLRDIDTPFSVEYARSSQSRGNAPTLVPVTTGGAPVKAAIHVLRADVSLELAKDWVWRREARKYGANDHYREKHKPGKNSVVIGSLTGTGGIETVLYTIIQANITPLTAEELAHRAIASARSDKVALGRDGITYLIDALRHGITTPLTDEYKKKVLQQANAASLEDALAALRPASALMPNEMRARIVQAFCEDCIWTRAVRTHFEVLFEGGNKRHQLLAESANTFFHDLAIVLQEYLLQQMHKLIDVGSTAIGKDNLTSNYLLGLDWTKQARDRLQHENAKLLAFREKIGEARRKLLAHTDLRARLDETSIGSFLPADEAEFWAALQHFVDTAHDEAIGGPFEIAAAMPDGDASSLVHRQADAVDYDDLLIEQTDLLVSRIPRRRYGDA